MTTDVEAIQTPPANQRHLADQRADPARLRRLADGYDDAIRKLKTAAWVAASNGATWQEIVEAVRSGVADATEIGTPAAVSSATARARMHDGDDRL
jgi:hypothetical protein